MSSLRTRLVALTAALAVSGLTAAPAVATHGKEDDPRLTRKLFTSKQTQAWRAAQQDERFEVLARTPTARWMTDTWQPLSKVRRQAKKYADQANRAGKTPVLAIYAIPARDCGGYSAGGFSAHDYRIWIERMAAGLRGSHAMAVLEPDALGHLGDCAGQGDRTGLLRHATKVLSKAGVWVYLDAAHSGWVRPREMAGRLVTSGIARARGFSVNVASFVRTDIERRYARKVSKALKRLGVRDAHYVMDTSRNGGGQTDGNDWCNPVDARIGREPRVVAGRRLDAYVWVKAPGESDGYCNGGPAAGEWWSEGALRLLGLT